jgi:uncharacterized iron-regulated membrane protein
MLRTFRQWHTWLGLLLSVLFVLVAVTGILLNHKDVFFHRGEGPTGPTGVLRSTSDLHALPIGFEQALLLARQHYGDVPLDKIELKDERGWLAYKVSRGNGREIRIDAHSGEVFTKYGAKPTRKEGSAVNWAKIVTDLHSGKILGTAGKLAIDATAVAMLGLTLTGVYLWWLPKLRKRQNARRRTDETRQAEAKS